ncbi:MULTISPECIES: hypothetical protein [unclassified Campylobacter]|uniref:hypothetical protein n=1 Tax=unclassified Campylobacter TaxID=2593542 RepID=UPI001237F2C8|nr:MULTISPECIES: hypothetical protein [unclassified Campylobacter]KAA6228468.1 hypothetical protein FMM54_01010 [Campylobacter sp. LR185c]KAA6228954.1 hypothetical protein FMM55_00550 [Campylobacter sp. LR196d]KAA6229440.1 hypothetical protein FMM57_01015 [Campylobacter sp. LR286c]KAA6229906.1 hypothetical protein FMM56_07695 [Campylobacter sp. LR264d]KAA6234119.1 hypothetical protein FMM58_01110 [Campylobacter sp. LR291e]
MANKFTQFSLNFIFKISEQPVLLKDLLEANALFNEGMLVDYAKLNFKLKMLNAYIYYGILCFLILVPLLLITHYLFTRLDFHISILSSILVTAVVFIGFDIFKVYTRKIMSKNLILKAWANHFPCFAYEKYSSIVEEIYKQALKDEVSKTNLEKYVLEKIVENHSK